MKQLFVVLILSILSLQYVYAQNVLRGRIFDSDNEPVIGASVTIKGTAKGSISDLNGVFSIEVPDDNSVIVVSSVGFITSEVNVSGLTSVDIQLKIDVIGMDEVVVIGYGSMKRSDLTGAVTSIQSEELIKNRSPNFLEAMQGKVAGVKISTQSGEPGSNIEVKIRGANSLNASTSPLYVIDGIQMDVNTFEIAAPTIASNSSMSPLSNINPADIESIEILKDASATAIFGSRGANGVILITTRSGREGKTAFNYEYNIGMATPTKRMNVLNGDEYLDYQRFLNPYSSYFWIDGNNDGKLDSTDIPRDLSGVKKFNWQDEMLRTAVTQSHDFNISGGTNSIKYSASLGYLDQQGIIRNNDYQRYNGRIKVDYSRKRISAGFNLNSSYSVQEGVSSASGPNDYNGVVQFVTLSKPVDLNSINDDWITGGKFIYPTTMIDDAEKNIDIMRLMGNSYFRLQLLDGLHFQAELGANLSSSKGKEFYGKETSWGFISNGKGVIQENRSMSWFHRDVLTYVKEFGAHRINLMGGFEVNSYNFESFLVSMASFADESTGINDISKGSVLDRVNSTRWGTNRVSYLGRLNYNFMDRYLLTVSMRGDGSDKFGPGNRYGYFPSTALAWRVSEESFMKDVKGLSNLKLRLSYGATGNERIPAYSYFAHMQNAYYSSNGTLLLGLAPSSRANSDLKWESTLQWNAGLDVGFFENRLSMTIEYFSKQTRDMLLLAPVSAQTGYSEQWSNIGRVDNNGFEFLFISHNIDKKDFKWITSFNISTNKSEVVDLGDVEFIPVTIYGGWFTNVGRVIKGESLGTAFGYEWDGIYQIEDFTWQNGSDPSIPHEERIYELKPDVVSVAGTTVKPGSFRFRDLNNDNIVDELKDRKVISHSFPKHFGGFNNNFSYRNFDLSVFFEWSYGNEILNVSKIRSEGYQGWMNLNSDFWSNRWTPENPTNEYGTISLHNATSALTSSYYVEDASYLRLKNLYFGYRFNTNLINRIGLSSATIYLSATNLLTFTRYTGWDPEIYFNNQLLPGFDRFSYPKAKTLSLGIKVSF